MKFKAILSVLFLIFFIKGNAQKLELGKVSMAELQEKKHPKDSSAVAAIVFKKGETRYSFSQAQGFVMITEVTTRIKIYKKEGYDWANQEVSYYLDGNLKEEVSFSDAITYNLVDGKIEKTKLKGDGEFSEKTNKYWGQKKISMPNIKAGSVIEFKYTMKSPSYGKIRDWDFQTSIPVNHSEFITNIPEYFEYRTNQKGFVFPKVSVEKNQKSVNYSYKAEMSESGNVFNPSSREKLDFSETQTTYIAQNIPAMKEEGYVNNIKNYTSSVSYELSSIKFPNQLYENFATDWETVTKKIYKFDSFGPELEKKGYFENEIDALMKETKTQNELIYSIFNYIKSSVKWNGSFGFSCDEGVKKAYKDKTGNVAEINLMLTAMLRFAGITANPVLVSTRSNGIPLFPSIDAFNYVITAVEVQDKIVLLDATEPYSLPNILPLRDLNWSGRLIRKDGTSTQVDLTPKTLSKEVKYLNITLKNDGTAAGKVRNQFFDYEAFLFRKAFLATNNDTYLEELENQNNNIEISDYVRDNDFDLSKPIVETYAFKSNKEVEIIGDKIYFSPLFFFATKQNPFKQETREYPVDFYYPTETKFNISIEIPDGYAIESMPKGVNAISGDDIGTFKYTIANTDNKIQVLFSSTLNTAIVPADLYDVLKAFYQQMIDKQNEKIVLKKI